MPHDTALPTAPMATGAPPHAASPVGQPIKDIIEAHTSELAQANARLQAEIAERKRVERRIHGLNRLKGDLLAPGSLPQKLQRITDGVVDVFDADFARVWMTSPGDRCDTGCAHASLTEGPHVCRFRDRCLHLMASSGRYTHLDGDVHRRVPFGCYKIGRVAAGDDPKFITNDCAHDPRVHNHQWAAELGLQAFAGYRLLARDQTPLGVLALFSQHVVSPEEDSLLETVANASAQVIQTMRAEQKLEAYTRELEKSNEEIKRFAYIVSHDLRAPLVNLKGFAGELTYALRELTEQAAQFLPHLDAELHSRLDALLRNDIPEALQFIGGSVSRMDRLINAILKLSRLGRQELRPEPVEIAPLVEQLLQTLAHEIDTRGVEVHVAPLPTLATDRLAIDQILGNLLANAVKYLKPHGPAELRIDAQPGAQTTALRIADNGIGIPPQSFGRIFEPFGRVATSDVPGEGMGLAYARSLARRLGGDITCQSQPGQGSTFTVTLPHQFKEGQHSE